jgi:hypothetical protein
LHSSAFKLQRHDTSHWSPMSGSAHPQQQQQQQQQQPLLQRLWRSLRTSDEDGALHAISLLLLQQQQQQQQHNVSGSDDSAWVNSCSGDGSALLHTVRGCHCPWSPHLHRHLQRPHLHSTPSLLLLRRRDSAFASFPLFCRF